MKRIQRIIFTALFWVLLFVPINILKADVEKNTITPLFVREITLSHKDSEFVIPQNIVESWIEMYPKYYYQDFEIDVTHFEDPDLLFHRKDIQGINSIKLQNYIQSEIAPQIFTEKSDVSINFADDTETKLIFDGVGKNGVEVDLKRTIQLITYFLRTQEDISIDIPTITHKAQIQLLHENLQGRGIEEIIAVGESDFSGSSSNRVHNIDVGKNKLANIILPQNEIYSVNANLGPVDGSTGYKKELVIKGAKTVPDYGGGLCQVSSTLYRGALRAGLPITQRINHSYAVSYYEPYGTDATIYAPLVDLKFKNDTTGDIAIQSYRENGKLYFILYGTNDGRKTNLYGPYISNWQSPPPPRVEQTTVLPPGEKKVYGKAVPGLDATWYRIVTDKTGEQRINETIFSRYQARPYYYAIGLSTEPIPLTEEEIISLSQ